MFKNIDWCDIDSDEEFIIPELPPLPLVESFSFPSSAVDKEDQRASSATVSETSERSSSAAGSGPTPAPEEHGKKNSDRFRFDFAREKSNKNSSVSEYVCFIGKLPPRTTITDMKKFLDKRGIDFTDIRMGPKKGANANVFGYVDIPTKKDYEKMLTFDGFLYEGHRIRVDHASHKEYSPHRKNTRTRKRNQCSRFRYMRKDSQQKSWAIQHSSSRSKADFTPISRNKSYASMKSRNVSGRFASGKPQGYAQNYETNGRNWKRGPQSRSKYIKSPKINKTVLSNTARPLELYDRKKYYSFQRSPRSVE